LTTRVSTGSGARHKGKNIGFLESMGRFIPANLKLDFKFAGINK
jgi:hypothetical protein